MARFGRCLSLADCIANVSLSGGATGTWDAAAGTFEATLPAGGSCGGSNASPFAVLTLVLQGSATLQLDVDGDGERFAVDRTQAVITHRGDTVVSYGSEGGGLTDCSSSPLELRTGEAGLEIAVCCGDEIVLSFASSLNEFQPELSCTFVLSEP